MRAGMIADIPKRGAVALGTVSLLLLAVPAFADDYVLSVLILVLYLAYLGLAWNIMMGFAGLLSLGHALYIGLGAYTGAALYVHLGVSPWLAMPVAAAIAGAAGALIGYLGFRFSIQGVYFALLTIAFAEFIRILFDHWEWVNGSGGLFIPAESGAPRLAVLHGPPAMFYYLLLAMTAAALAGSRAIMRSKLGYYWLAIREDQEAAQSLGVDILRYKMYAVVLSAALTSLAGVVNAFYYRNLFPEQVFSIHSSIEILLAPILGGVGTLIGPVLGAFILTPIGEVLTVHTEPLHIPGVKQVFWGVVVVLIVLYRPEGVWPWAAGRFGFAPRAPR